MTDTARIKRKSVLKGKYHANLMSFQNQKNVCLSTETKIIIV